VCYPPTARRGVVQERSGLRDEAAACDSQGGLVVAPAFAAGLAAAAFQMAERQRFQPAIQANSAKHACGKVRARPAAPATCRTYLGHKLSRPAGLPICCFGPSAERCSRMRCASVRREADPVVVRCLLRFFRMGSCRCRSCNENKVFSQLLSTVASIGRDLFSDRTGRGDGAAGDARRAARGAGRGRVGARCAVVCADCLRAQLFSRQGEFPRLSGPQSAWAQRGRAWAAACVSATPTLRPL
jgi:hypothetical protein